MKEVSRYGAIAVDRRRRLARLTVSDAFAQRGRGVAAGGEAVACEEVATMEAAVVTVGHVSCTEPIL